MLNEILFSIILFTVVFCLECCLLYNPQRSGKLSSISLHDNTESCFELDDSLKLKLEPQIENESKPSHLVNSKNLEIFTVGYIDSLQLEQARKLAKEWGIKLSVKGKKKRLNWLKRELRLHLQKFSNSGDEKGLSFHDKAS